MKKVVIVLAALMLTIGCKKEDIQPVPQIETSYLQNKMIGTWDKTGVSYDSGATWDHNSEDHTKFYIYSTYFTTDHEINNDYEVINDSTFTTIYGGNPLTMTVNFNGDIMTWHPIGDPNWLRMKKIQ